MFDQLLESFKGEALGKITEQFGLSEKEANGAVEVVGNEVQNSVSNEVSKGNISGLMGMFEDADGDGIPDVLEGIGGNVVSGLVSKLGMSEQKADGIASSLIPMAINFFTGKMKSESASSGMDLTSLIGSFIGGGDDANGGKTDGNSPLGGLTGMLGGLFGNK